MAYALKYNGTFFSKVFDFEYSISIYKDGFVGASTELTFGNVSINRGNSDLLQSIKGSESTIEVVNSSDFEFEGEFGTANYGDFYVTIEKDASIIWQGYNIPNTYTEPYEQTPYLTELKFNCGLGHLKYKKFQDSGVVYSGQKSILEVLRLCLNKLPNASNISQSIRESINTYETRLYSGTPTRTDSMINAIFVDSGLYKDQVEDGDGISYEGWTCYDVIEEILKVFGARIYSWNNLWFIDQIREQKTSPVYYRDFLPRVGTESTLTVDGSGSYAQRQTVNRTTVHPTSEGEISILPALEKIKYKYTTQNEDFFANDLINNGNFTSLTTFDPATYPNSNGTPFNWSYVGFDPSSYSAILVNGQNSNWFQFDPSSYVSNTEFNSGVYLWQQKTGVGLASSDSLRLSFRSYISADWTTGTSAQYNLAQFYSFVINAKVVFKLKIKIGSYYLSGYPNNLTWTLTESFVIVERRMGNGPQGQIPQVYTSSGTIWSDVNIVIDSPTIPVSGTEDFEFYVYEPYHEYNNFTTTGGYSVSFDQAFFTSISAIYNPASSPAEEVVILEHIIDEEAEEISIDVVHGDGPATVSQGSFRLSSGLPTIEWNRYGVAETKGIAEIWIEDVSELRSAYTRELSWNLKGYLEQFNVIAHTVDAVTTYYLINGFNFDLVQSSYELSLIKLLSSSRSAYTTKQSDTLTKLPVLAKLNPTEKFLTFNNAVSRSSFTQTSNVESIPIENYLNYKKTGYNGFYTFNENDTTTIRDYSQEGNDGTGSNLTISDTTRTYGKDAVFNGTTSKIDFPSTTDWQGILLLSFRISVNITSNSGTDTILKIPNVLELKFDGTYFILDFETIVTTYTITQTGTAIVLGDWYDVEMSTKINSFNLAIYDNDGTEVFNSTASKADVTNTGSFPVYLGYDGSTNYANFKCNELQLCDSAFATGTSTAYLNEQNGVLITTDSSAYTLGDIIASDWENDLNSGIVTYIGTNEIKILPVDGQFYGNAYSIERAGHLWDTSRQWQFIINDTPSICFYDGVNLTTLIASASTKLYCLGIDGILKTLISINSNYTLTNGDEIILVDCSSADVTITCPSIADATPTGKVFEIIDIGNANPNCVIVAGGDYTINGETSSTITEPYEVRKIIFTGTEYILI